MTLKPPTYKQLGSAHLYVSHHISIKMKDIFTEYSYGSITEEEFMGKVKSNQKLWNKSIEEAMQDAIEYKTNYG